MILVSAFGLLLAAFGTANADQITLARERLACTDVGIDQRNPAFNQCVANLDASLWDQQQLNH
jgi:hypothetical protein